HSFDDPIIFSADGKLLALHTSVPKQEGTRSFREDYKVRLFDVASGTERLALPVKGWYQPLAFSPDGKLLAVGADDTIQVAETASGKEVWRSPEPEVRIAALAFAPDGKSLAAGLDDCTILVWDITRMPEK